MNKTLAWNNSDRNWLAQQKDKNLSRTTCYNYNKKSYFANQCLTFASQKTSIGLDNFLVGD